MARLFCFGFIPGARRISSGLSGGSVFQRIVCNRFFAAFGWVDVLLRRRRPPTSLVNWMKELGCPAAHKPGFLRRPLCRIQSSNSPSSVRSSLSVEPPGNRISKLRQERHLCRTSPNLAGTPDPESRFRTQRDSPFILKTAVDRD
jgi:hypothetical protein